jgi:Family of unknown function (DUF6088)
MKYSTHNQIFNKITKNKRGKLFFPSDFSSLGNTDAIRSSLHRLERDHVLERLAHGIYLYPKIDPVFGSLYPSTEEIAESIARRDHARIIPTGPAALHKLRLTTQVPMNVIYLMGRLGKSRSENNELLLSLQRQKSCLLRERSVCW